MKIRIFFQLAVRTLCHDSKEIEYNFLQFRTFFKLTQCFCSNSQMSTNVRFALTRAIRKMKKNVILTF